MKIKDKIKLWIQRADRQDRRLGKKKRFQKWILITGTVSVLFLLSFVRSWRVSVDHYPMPQNPPGAAGPSDSMPQQNTPFELPVDSFEQLLKKKIDEEHIH